MATTFQRKKLNLRLAHWAKDGKNGDPLVCVSLFHRNTSMTEPIETWPCDFSEKSIETLCIEIEKLMLDDAEGMEGSNKYALCAYFSEDVREVSPGRTPHGARLTWDVETILKDDDAETDDLGRLKGTPQGFATHVLRWDNQNRASTRDEYQFIIKQLRGQVDEREKTIIALSKELEDSKKQAAENIRVYNDLIRIDATIKNESEDKKAARERNGLLMERGLLLGDAAIMKMSGSKLPLLSQGGSGWQKSLENFVKTLSPEQMPKISAAFYKPGQMQYLEGIFKSYLDSNPQSRLLLLAGMPDFIATIDADQLPLIMNAFDNIGQGAFIATLLDAFLPAETKAEAQKKPPPAGPPNMPHPPSNGQA